jgi:hypothetical protein
MVFTLGAGLIFPYATWLFVKHMDHVEKRKAGEIFPAIAFVGAGGLLAYSAWQFTRS